MLSRKNVNIPFVIFICSIIILLVLVFFSSTSSSSSPTSSSTLSLHSKHSKLVKEFEEKEHRIQQQEQNANEAILQSSSSSLTEKERKQQKHFHILTLGDSNTQDGSSVRFPFYLSSPNFFVMEEENNNIQKKKSFNTTNVTVYNFGFPNVACSRRNKKYSVWNRPSFKHLLLAAEKKENQNNNTSTSNNRKKKKKFFPWEKIDVVTVAFGTNDARSFSFRSKDFSSSSNNNNNIAADNNVNINVAAKSNRKNIFAGDEEFRACLIAMIERVKFQILNSVYQQEDSNNNNQNKMRIVKILLMTPPRIVAGVMTKKYHVSRYLLEKHIVPTIRNVSATYEKNIQKKEERLLAGMKHEIENEESPSRKFRVRVIVKLVDVYEAMKEDFVKNNMKSSKYLDNADGVHVSEEGAKFVASLVRDEILK